MAKLYKPGDTVTARVLSVELGLMVVNLDGMRMDFAMPNQPMTHKQLMAEGRKITRTWEKHYGVTVKFPMPAE